MAHLTPGSSNGLLDDIVVDHGPNALLGRFFLHATHAVRDRGVRLQFGSFAELLVVNRQNRASWLPLTPSFNLECSDLTEDRSFCILGLDDKNDVVATHAARLFEWPDTNFHKEAESLRLHYADPERSKLEGESCEVTAIAAAQIKGRVAYTGAVWYRPDFRGKDLARYISRIARAYAFTRWNTEFSVAMASKGVVRGGVVRQTGHASIDWSVSFRNCPFGTLELALCWVTPALLLDDLSEFPTDAEAEGTDAVHLRRA